MGYAAPYRSAIVPPVGRRSKHLVRRLGLQGFAPWLVARFLGAWGRTWRYRTEGWEQTEAAIRGEAPVLGAFLHARWLHFVDFFRRGDRGRWQVMISQSRDGDFLSGVVHGLGLETARGSRSRGGGRALRAMIAAVNEHRELGCVMAVDGSRPPRGVVEGGVVTLASRTGGVIIAAGASSRPGWIVKQAWDRMLIPLPFARVALVFAEPVWVPAEVTPEEHEAFRALVEERLLAATRRADELVGFRDAEPLQVADPRSERAESS